MKARLHPKSSSSDPRFCPDAVVPLLNRVLSLQDAMQLMEYRMESPIECGGADVNPANEVRAGKLLK